MLLFPQRLRLVPLRVDVVARKQAGMVCGDAILPVDGMAQLMGRGQPGRCSRSGDQHLKVAGVVLTISLLIPTHDLIDNGDLRDASLLSPRPRRELLKRKRHLIQYFRFIDLAGD